MRGDPAPCLPAGAIFVTRRTGAGRTARSARPLLPDFKADLAPPRPRAVTASNAFLAEVEAGLPALQHLPALIVWGDADSAFREPEHRRWRTLLPHPADVTLPGAGHFVQSDAGAELAEALRAWC